MMTVRILVDHKTSIAQGKFGPNAPKLALGLEGRKTWMSPERIRFETSQHNIDLFKSVFPSVELQDERLSQEAIELLDELENAPVSQNEPAFVLPPRDFQLDNWNRFKDQPQWAIFSEQGCVDRDTEYLSPEGWVKISEYDGGKVAQYELDGTASFVQPTEYVVKDCDTMAHFKTKYGCDQMLSLDHRMLLLSSARPSRHGNSVQWWREEKGKVGGVWLFETTPEKLISRFSANSSGAWRKNKIPTTFVMDSDKGIDLSDAEIRLQVAFIADGSYGTKEFDNPPSGKRAGCIKIKKMRKIERLRALLQETGTEYSETQKPDGFSVFVFYPPVATKHFVDSFWWSLPARQKEIISKECLLWDGDGKDFFSARKEDADYIQFCFSSTGTRSRVSMYCGLYYVTQSAEPVGITKPKIVSAPGGKMYCFRVPSSYLVFPPKWVHFCFWEYRENQGRI
jgi:hypothetical protein